MPNEVLEAFASAQRKTLRVLAWHPLTSLVLPLLFYFIRSTLTLAVKVFYISLKFLLPLSREYVFVL